MLEKLSLRSLSRPPITVCVLGMVAATALSHIYRFNVYYLTIVMEEFPKVVLYYLILVGVVNTKARLLPLPGDRRPVPPGPRVRDRRVAVP